MVKYVKASTNLYTYSVLDGTVDYEFDKISGKVFEDLDGAEYPNWVIYHNITLKESGGKSIFMEYQQYPNPYTADIDILSEIKKIATPNNSISEIRNQLWDLGFTYC